MKERSQDTLKTGTITRLVLQQKNIDRVSVFLDDEFAFGLYKDTVIAHQLRKGVLLSIEQQQALLLADSFHIAKSSALNYLARRMHSVQEIRRKLKQKEFPENVIEEVIVYLGERQYLDDAVFAKMFAESRFASKKYGSQRIKMELMKRGVAKNIVENALKKVFSKIDITETIQLQAEKQWEKLQREPDVRKRQQKLYAYLARRGFESDAIMATIRRLKEE